MDTVSIDGRHCVSIGHISFGQLRESPGVFEGLLKGADDVSVIH